MSLALLVLIMVCILTKCSGGAMKGFALILASLIFILLISSCLSQSGNLPIATYEGQQNSSYHQRIAFKDKHFIQVGTAMDPDKKMKNKKIGQVETGTSDSKLYVYSISEYDENNFLFIEEFESNMLNNDNYKELNFYVSIDVENIPFKFIYMNLRHEVEIYYEQKEYHYYSKAPSDFELGERLGKTSNKQGIVVVIFSIFGQTNNGWIAVKENDNDDIIRLFWSNLTESLPMEYLEFPQKYPDIDYLQKHMN